jgi:ribosomal protein L30/L7E
MLPQVKPMLPQVKPMLPQVKPMLPQVKPMLPQVKPMLPQVKAMLSQVKATGQGHVVEPASLALFAQLKGKLITHTTCLIHADTIC